MGCRYYGAICFVRPLRAHLTQVNASDTFGALYSIKAQPAPPKAVQRFAAGSVAVPERVGSGGGGPLNWVSMASAPLAVQIPGRP